MPNPKESLQEAHALMCVKVLTILQNPEATLAELKFAKDFLKDNRIEALDIPGSPMGQAADAARGRNVLKLPEFPGAGLFDEDEPAGEAIG